MKILQCAWHSGRCCCTLFVDAARARRASLRSPVARRWRLPCSITPTPIWSGILPPLPLLPPIPCRSSSLGATNFRSSAGVPRTVGHLPIGHAAVDSVRTKPVVSFKRKPPQSRPQVLAFDEPRPNAFFDPTPIGPANPIVLASLGLIPVSHVDLATAEPPKHDFHYLAYYAYSETPPPEKPADTVLNSIKDIPVGTPIEEIRRAARRLRSGFRLHESRRQDRIRFRSQAAHRLLYRALSAEQIRVQPLRRRRHPNPRDNAIAAAYKIIVEAELFELRTHKKPTLSDLYLIHQQGIQGAEEHVSHPDRIAWQSMCATEEGQQKGEKWCKRAIWQNTLPAIKKVWKSVDNLTSAAFVAHVGTAGRRPLRALFQDGRRGAGEVVHLSPPRGESIGVLRTPFFSKSKNADPKDRLCGAKRRRVRGPLRDSELRGSSNSVSDIPAILNPADRPPHPTLLPARGEKEERAAKKLNPVASPRQAA